MKDFFFPSPSFPNSRDCSQQSSYLKHSCTSPSRQEKQVFAELKTLSGLLRCHEKFNIASNILDKLFADPLQS